MTSKGQTTTPKDVRKRLNLHPRDCLKFVVDKDGRVLVLPASIDASELAGMFKSPARTVSLEDISRAIRKRGGRRLSVSTRILVRHLVQDDPGMPDPILLRCGT